MGVPVTVKLRSGLRPGDESGVPLAHRLVEEAGVAAIAFHPRSAAVHHKGEPDYELAARLVESLPAPVILTGGLGDAGQVREAFERTGAAAVMLARGALGNPWLFAELLGGAELRPDRDEVLAELDWTIERAVEHLGEQRAARYLRKFYPWYVRRLGLDAGRGQEHAGIAADGAHARVRAGASGPPGSARDDPRLRLSRRGQQPRYTAPRAEALRSATSPPVAGFCVPPTGPPTLRNRSPPAQCRRTSSSPLKA